MSRGEASVSKPTLAQEVAEIRKKAAALGVKVHLDLKPDESTTRLTFVCRPSPHNTTLAFSHYKPKYPATGGITNPEYYVY